MILLTGIILGFITWFVDKFLIQGTYLEYEECWINTILIGYFISNGCIFYSLGKVLKPLILEIFP